MKCIIIDDEPLARKLLQNLIEETGLCLVYGCFSNTRDAIIYMKENVIDLIFLDINMPEQTGLDFAETKNGNELIIFTTAYPQYALEAFELEAIDYLLKPVRIERLQKALAKALFFLQSIKSSEQADEHLERVNKYNLIIKSDRKFFNLPFAKILYIEGLKDYVTLYTPSRKIISAVNIKNIYAQLPRDLFIRISKSYIVNIQHIESFDQNNVYLVNEELPLGSAFKEEFFEVMVKGLNSRKAGDF